MLQLDQSLEPLAETDFPNFGLKAASVIESAPDPLVALRDISQNLPIVARSIANQKEISPATRDRFIRNQQMIDEGTNLVLLNGQRLDIETVDPFGYVLRLIVYMGYMARNL